MVANISVGCLLRLITCWGDCDHLVSHLPETDRLNRKGCLFKVYLPLIFAGFQLQIEQGTDLLVKQNLRKYWKTIPLTFTLFLTTIVLTNASKGENILNIIAPPADKPFTNFRELYKNGGLSFTQKA